MPYQSLSNYFNSQCRQILQNDATEVYQWGLTIQNFLQKSKTDLRQMIQYKKNRELYSLLLESAEQIKTDCEENRQLIIGRRYALDLINNVRKDVSLLIGFSDQNTRKEWHSRLRQLENPSTLRKTKDTAQYVLSTLLSPLTLLNRALVSTPTQAKMSSLFDTFDSECKKSLEDLANSKIKQIGNEIDRMEKLIAKFAGNDPEVIQLINEASIEDLQTIMKKLNSEEKLFIQFKQSYKLLKILNRYAELTQEIDHVIRTYNTRFIRICVIISRLFSINITEDARRIIKLEKIKKEISTISNQMETTLSEQQDRIRERSQNTSPLPEKLDSLRIVTPTSSAVNTLRGATNNITSFFGQLRASHQPEEADEGVDLAP